jgi:hypothetical protein
MLISDNNGSEIVMLLKKPAAKASITYSEPIRVIADSDQR